jgi:molybdopterin synthase sulfur carrier subunit
MNIELRFFAGVREALGVSRETVSLPDSVQTVGQVRDHLRERGGAWAETLSAGRALRMACDQVTAKEDAPIREGCEVAFFPPVTGG